MLQISHDFFKKVAAELGIKLNGERDYGIGMFFFPQDTLKRNQAKKMFEVITEKEGLKFLGWRTVPVNPGILGQKAKDCMPYIMQAIIERPEEIAKGLDFDRKLYVIRRVFEQSNDNTYVVSLSSRTIVYKGMLNSIRIYRTRITNLQSQWFIQDFQQTQIPAGKEHIPTDLYFTTAKSTLSEAM